MKFFHLSDLHLGLDLHKHDLLEDQKYVLSKVIDEAGKQKPEAVVIAGDVYDRANPGADAIQLFDWFTSELARVNPDGQIIVISGNHDSGARLSVYNQFLRDKGLHISGMPPMQDTDHMMRVRIEDEHGPVNFYLLPFVKPTMVNGFIDMSDVDSVHRYEAVIRALIEREDIDDTQRNVIVSHQYYAPGTTQNGDLERMDSECPIIGGVDKVSQELLSPFDYAALGHLHKPMANGSETVRYCGTPLACSVSESGQEKGIVVVEMGQKGDVKTSVVPLEPLRKIRAVEGTVQEILSKPSEDFVCATITEPYGRDDQDRIRESFPNLLYIKSGVKVPDGAAEEKSKKYFEEKGPLDICKEFLGADATSEQIQLLEDIIRAVQQKA